MGVEMDIQKIGFGDFCTIEQKRYVGPNEFYSYKVVGRKKSNVWTDVPVDANNEKETLHDHLDDVVTVVCNNLDDRTVHQFRVSDLASVRKAQAVPEGFVLVPKKPDVDKAWSIALKRIVPPPKTNDAIQKELMCKKYVDDLYSEQDRILLDYEAMIEAQEQKVTEMKINWGMGCPRCNHNEAIIHSTAEKDSGYEFMNGDAVNCLKCGNIGEMDANGEDSDIVWNEDEAQEQNHD